MRVVSSHVPVWLLGGSTVEPCGGGPCSMACTQAANAARELNGEPSLILICTAIRRVPPSAVAQRCGLSGAESGEWAPSLLICFRRRECCWRP